MRVIRRSKETLVVLPTDVNRNLGIFLAFLGLTASCPTWYLYCVYFSRVPKEWHGWLPAFGMAAALIFAGYLLAAHSRKRITVAPDVIKVREGLFRKPLEYRWQEAPSIRLQRLDSEQESRTRTLWITKLVTGRHEFVVDERHWVALKARLLDEIDSSEDSLRLYFLDEVARHRTEHYGVAKPPDLEEPLIL